jgi:PAS domain S-box-containing protein
MEAAQREGERYYRHVIDSAVDGYFAIDIQRRVIEVNDTLCELFGIPRAEWIGKTPLDFVAEESRAELIAQMQRIETTDRRRYQLVARRKDGSTFPILLNNSTHRNEKGEVTGAFGFVTDLTPVLEAQRAMCGIRARPAGHPRRPAGHLLPYRQQGHRHPGLALGQAVARL